MSRPSQEPPPAPTPEQAASLAERYLPLFRERGSLSKIVGGEELGLGVRTLPHVVLEGRVMEFIGVLYEEGWVYSFDWPSWTDAARLLVEDLGALERASLEEVRKLLTTIVRQDRFSDGTLAEMIENGVLERVLTRLEALGRNAQG